MRFGGPRFVFFIIVLGGLGAALLRPMGGAAAAFSLAFDIAAVVYMALVARLMLHARPDDIRRHAAQNDLSRSGQAAIATVLVAVIMVTVLVELRPAANNESIWSVAFPILTIGIAWVFGNLVYTLHYAHLYYRPGAAEPARALGFPHTKEPNYGDFAYFSFNLGMTYQVSDVTVNSTPMRLAVTIHAMIAFFYNIGILALALNIAAGAIGK